MTRKPRRRTARLRNAEAGEAAARDEAISMSERAPKAGLPRADLLESDEAFAPLRADARWAALVARVSTPAGG